MPRKHNIHAALSALCIAAVVAMTGCSTLTRLGIGEDATVAAVRLALTRQGLAGAVTDAQVREIANVVKANERLQQIGEEVAADARVQAKIDELVAKYMEDGAVVDPAATNEPIHELALTVTSLTADTVKFDWAPKVYAWPVKVVGAECDAVLEMRLANGQGGKVDWIRKGGQSSKGLENIHDGYGVWKTLGVPGSGEPVTFRWVSVDGKRRSNDAAAVWP
jgi:hypothetical protein